ncbi:MAG: glycoside hydrolase family 43 protein [Acidimicrobiales bacterium]
MVYPQLIPMLSRTRRTRRSRRGRRRRATALTGALILVLAASGVLLLGTAATAAPRRLERATTDRAAADRAADVAAAQSVEGLDASQTIEQAYEQAYFEPPVNADPEAPATMLTLGADQPDPFMVYQDGHYYLFASQAEQTANIPVLVATRLGYWGPVIDAMPQVPAWAVPGDTRAPDVHRFGHHYVLYFSEIVRGTFPQLRCIGDAVSATVAGPYRPAATPFICQLGLGGSIDPRTFVDGDGTPYLLWKSDENSDVNGTSLTNIFSQQLSPDGEHLLGQPTRIFGPDEAWQGRIVESPDLVEVHGAYDLFYSGSWFNQNGYAIGVARCAGPLGPCADTSATPLLASNAQGDGPGEESVFADAKGLWLLYTPWRSDLPDFTTPRPVAMVRLGFGPDGPYLGPPPVLASATTADDS